ncbi:MAG: hypothetical protein RMK49_10015 [Abditibacteriales bacterium]|nr:hypothetical protein [Abditibacteriales bacterium]
MQTRKGRVGISIRFKRGVLPDIPKALELIKVRDFQPRLREVFVTATGTVASEDGRWVLNLDSMKTPARFVLLPSDDKDGAATFGKVKQFSAQQALVELEGQWQPPAAPNDPKSLPALKVIAVRQRK